MSMIDVPTLFERNGAGRCQPDQDHTYCSEDDGYSGTPLAQRLTQFRNEGIGCDVQFIVGTEQKVSLPAHSPEMLSFLSIIMD